MLDADHAVDHRIPIIGAELLLICKLRGCVLTARQAPTLKEESDRRIVVDREACLLVARFQIAVIDDLRLHCPFNERRLRAASKPRVVGIERNIKLVRRPDRAQRDGRARIGIGERRGIADGGKYVVFTRLMPCGERPARFLRNAVQPAELERLAAAREHRNDERAVTHGITLCTESALSRNFNKLIDHGFRKLRRAVRILHAVFQHIVGSALPMAVGITEIKDIFDRFLHDERVCAVSSIVGVAQPERVRGGVHSIQLECLLGVLRRTHISVLNIDDEIARIEYGMIGNADGRRRGKICVNIDDRAQRGKADRVRNFHRAVERDRAACLGINPVLVVRYVAKAYRVGCGISGNCAAADDHLGAVAHIDRAPCALRAFNATAVHGCFCTRAEQHNRARIRGSAVAFQRNAIVLHERAAVCYRDERNIANVFVARNIKLALLHIASAAAQRERRPVSDVEERGIVGCRRIEVVYDAERNAARLLLGSLALNIRHDRDIFVDDDWFR